ncbi:uncharacterized protein LOC121249308 [Juglans microcarpa x Juglans regia]|uniref:uncharacterized protein LOC121249308 n=1 Tax=Juglans microcarpa x Juglans regia TaxID=2249226 RepID=UPI001B7E5BFA|nr:uncharacterized protein LOC121249308 [Juglans microcarpa x Juglans regia]
MALCNLELQQLDVKAEFLHDELEETIYMHQLEEFIVEGREDRVYKLKKSLYGLKQSSRQSYRRFDSFMIDYGYLRDNYDISLLKTQLNNEVEMKDLDEVEQFMASVPCSNAVDNIMYAIVCTCPDISQAVSIVSSSRVVDYVDSDYTRNLAKRRSLTGQGKDLLRDGLLLVEKAPLQVVRSSGVSAA